MSSKNILIIPIGGFGNNLYQISFGLFLENKGYDVNYDFFLTKKNIFTKILGWKTYDDIYKIVRVKQKKTSNIFRLLILVKLLFSKIIKATFDKTKFVLPNDKLEELNLEKIRTLCGYFQEKHQIFFYKEGVELMINLLSIERSNKSKISHSIENIIHFRGGDSNFLDENLQILEFLKKSAEKWVIITDDPLYLENKLGLIKRDFINSSPINDFFTLSSAKKKLICSNSTFSWWAAHLISKKTVVFFPKSIYLKSGYWGKGKVHIISKH